MHNHQDAEGKHAIQVIDWSTAIAGLSCHAPNHMFGTTHLDGLQSTFTHDHAPQQLRISQRVVE